MLQARSATLDVEVHNIDDLLKDLMVLRQQWQHLFVEAKAVAGELGIPIDFPVKQKRQRKQFFNETADDVDDSSASNAIEDTFKSMCL